MQRYFVENSKISNQKAIIENQDFHHIKNVMRMKTGDSIVVCDNNNHCYKSQIVTFNDHECIVELTEELKTTEASLHIDIAQALIKKDAFEFVVQKATELGAENIIPIETKHSIIKLDKKKVESKVKRWNTIAKEASEQSERTSKSTVYKPHNIKELPFEAYDFVIVMYARGDKGFMTKELFKTNRKILVLIGPEGGFDQSEIDYLKTISNIHFFTIPNRILRSETASLYMLSVMGYLSEIGD